ncbi:MAG TPA: hypothetical protein VGJ93_11030 [Desulfuromonadaceae bacterium]|jgi:hypothetical protein
MESKTFEGRTYERKAYFPWISWGAIFGGLASGMGTYIMLALLGLAAGMTAINPQSAEPLGKVPLITGIWTSISLILAAFMGGYVAARMSGLSRLADGILHGLVAWGASTLVFAFLITTSIGAVLGGAFSLVGQGAKTIAGGAAVTAGGVAGSPSSQNQLESLIKGSGGGGEINRQSLANLQERLSSGDREGAVNVLVSQMGFSQERATQVVNQGIGLVGSAQNLPQQARDTATTAVSGLSKISWGLFVGVLLSMGLGVAGGVVGSKATVKRRNPLPSGMEH